MAGKPESKPSSSKGSPKITATTIIIFGIVIICFNLIKTNYTELELFLKSLPFLLINFFARFAIFSIFFSIGMVIIIIIYINKENSIRKKIMDKVKVKIEPNKKGGQDASFENPKWKLVEEHINSDDQNKWKLAILESDIILSEMLDQLSLPGESIGEKLKAVETSEFNTIEQAWEAHKIRNAIAHQGSDFLLSQREAKRVIGLYSDVFKEFKII
ncbi:MAG: hypothetical protein WC827_01160 [Candidatus Paceibacterota bacterium]|jgi:hypothetical protein